MCKYCIIVLISAFIWNSNWPLYKIWYYEIYLINASKLWLLCIVHTNLSIKGKKKMFPCTNRRCGTLGAKLGARVLVHGNVDVEFGRKVFLVDCLLWKNIKYGKNKRVLFIRCVGPFHNSIFIDIFDQWVHGTLLKMRHQVDVQSIETKLNTTWFVFVLRV